MFACVVGQTALHNAAALRFVPAVQLLVAAGARIRHCKVEGSPHRSTPIVYAIKSGTGQAPPPTDDSVLAVLKVLMTAPNAAQEPECRGSDGITALGKACTMGLTKCAKFLLESKANPNTPLRGHIPPLGMAIMTEVKTVSGRREFPICQALVAAGACTHGVADSASFSELAISFGCAPSDPIVKWCKSVEAPAVLKCPKCGVNVTSAADFAEECFREVSSSDRAASFVPPCCSNPGCPLRQVILRKEMHPRLKKCSRCQQAAYCGTDCQKQHWRTDTSRSGNPLRSDDI